MAEKGGHWVKGKFMPGYGNRSKSGSAGGASEETAKDVAAYEAFRKEEASLKEALRDFPPIDSADWEFDRPEGYRGSYEQYMAVTRQNSAKLRQMRRAFEDSGVGGRILERAERNPTAANVAAVRRLNEIDRLYYVRTV